MQTHFSPSPQVDPHQNQDTVISLLQAVNRPGIESLIDYLLQTDYFVAPASTRFHNVFEGGLCQHSLNLVLAFSAANKQLLNPLPNDSVVICGVLHDLCKISVSLGRWALQVREGRHRPCHPVTIKDRYAHPTNTTRKRRNTISHGIMGDIYVPRA
jgi:23S rRNA maturation-related 3'-5' exoribonuclease YhaM